MNNGEDYKPHNIHAVLARTTTVLDRVEKRLDQGDRKFDEHDSRIKKLEGWRYYVVGISVGIVVCFKLAWSWITQK